MSDGLAVSVIVPVRNGEGVLGACLDGLAGQAFDGPFEVIVVDNGSTDASRSVAAAHTLRPRVLAETQPGSYAARNAGIAAAAGRVLAFTDADCIAEPGWLSAGLAAIDAGADLVGGAIVAIASASPSRWERYDRAVYLDQRRLIEADGLAATANLFVRAEAFAAVGPFDGRLRSSGDAEWCRRATGAGFRLAYAPAARVRHRPRTTLVDTWRLHRRLGAGWAQLSRQGRWPQPTRDPAMRLHLSAVAEATERDGPRVRRRQLVLVHSVVLAARWVGRLTGRA